MPSDGLSVFIEAAFKAKIDRNVDGNMALYEQDKVDNEAKPPVSSHQRPKLALYGFSLSTIATRMNSTM